jgi:16S rRNA (cytosine967-C5)-methyltransferase
VNPKRRRRLEQNLARLKLGVRVISELPAIGEGAQSFQKVLVDAPCSNTGVLRRRPDARWNWSEGKLAALVKLQAEILDACASRVEPGGVLVYSTCSNEPEENMAQVEAFLARHPDFSLAESRESVPYESGTDGAFAAKLVRTDRLAT